MFRKFHLFSILTFFFVLFASCAKKENTNSIVIATAANMQFAMQELSKTFTKNTGIECKLVVSSSGKLTAQIKEGAPYDVFVAANMKYPNEIYKHQLSLKTPRIYAKGRLIIWSFSNTIKPNLSDLSNEKIKHIALANPNTAPYGFAAMEVLKKEKLYESLKYKLVYGESISQTNQFITLQTADLGFTAMSVVMSPKMKNKGTWTEIPKNLYSPIKQGIVLINRKKNTNPKAQKFYDFIFSKQAQEILTSYGYDVE